MNKPTSSKGFTLLEVLIALSIFAITSSALIGSMTKQVSQTRVLKEKIIAHWVAENELNQLRLPEAEDQGNTSDDRLPRVGTRLSEVRMGDRNWQLRIDVSSTENEDIRRIAVEVFNEEDSMSEASLVELIGFIGRY